MPNVYAGEFSMLETLGLQARLRLRLEFSLLKRLCKWGVGIRSWEEGFSRSILGIPSSTSGQALRLREKHSDSV